MNTADRNLDIFFETVDVSPKIVKIEAKNGGFNL